LFERNKVENEYLEVYKNVGLGTTIWSPLASGLLSGKYNEGIPDGSRFAIEGFDWLKDRWMAEDLLARVKKLGGLAKELGVSQAALSIAWCVKNEHVTTAILGATKKAQLLDNLDALKVLPLLTPEIMQKIDEIAGTKPKLPEF
jgi:aryl-alcohol dehydrogenase-like predicted oxidoreductase